MALPLLPLVLAVPLPEYSVCSGHGAVGSASNGTLACFCFPLWSGPNCEIPNCGSCVNGDCVGEVGTQEVRCQCHPHYGGLACDMRVCPNDCRRAFGLNPLGGEQSLMVELEEDHRVAFNVAARIWCILNSK